MELLKLEQLIKPLNAEGFLTQLVEADEAIDVDQLLVLLDDEDPELNWQLQMMFISQVQQPTLLQFVVPLVTELERTHLGDLSRFLLALNTKLLISGFELNETEGIIYYRFLLPCLEAGIDPTLVIHTIWMISYQLDRFAPLLRSIVEGMISAQEGFVALEDNLKNWHLDSALP